MRVLIGLAPTPQPLVKVSVKENEVPTEKILVARVFSLQRKVIYQIKAKRLNYLIKDFISSNFKRRLSFLLSNSEVSSLLLKLQPFRVVKYSLPFYCIWLTDKRPKKGCEGKNYLWGRVRITFASKQNSFLEGEGKGDGQNTDRCFVGIFSVKIRVKS